MITLRIIAFVLVFFAVFRVCYVFQFYYHRLVQDYTEAGIAFPDMQVFGRGGAWSFFDVLTSDTQFIVEKKKRYKIEYLRKLRSVAAAAVVGVFLLVISLP